MRERWIALAIAFCRRDVDLELVTRLLAFECFFESPDQVALAVDVGERFAALWVGIIFLLSLPLFFLLVGFVTFPIGVGIVGIWVIYRVVRGWLRLRDGQPI